VAVSLMMRALVSQCAGFVVCVRCLGTSVAGSAAHRSLGCAGGRGAPRPRAVDRCGWEVTSWRRGGGPGKAGQLARGGDGRHVVGLAARAAAPVGAVQAVLGAPGDLQDVVGLAGLAVLGRRPDPRRAGVVGRFDQQPPADARAGLGDLALAGALGGLVQLRRRPSQDASRPDCPRRPHRTRSRRRE
jgi:hypothetical protein